MKTYQFTCGQKKAAKAAELLGNIGIVTTEVQVPKVVSSTVTTPPETTPAETTPSEKSPKSKQKMDKGFFSKPLVRLALGLVLLVPMFLLAKWSYKSITLPDYQYKSAAAKTINENAKDVFKTYPELYHYLFEESGSIAADPTSEDSVLAAGDSLSYYKARATWEDTEKYRAGETLEDSSWVLINRDVAYYSEVSALGHWWNIISTTRIPIKVPIIPWVWGFNMTITPFWFAVVYIMLMFGIMGGLGQYIGGIPVIMMSLIAWVLLQIRRLHGWLTKNADIILLKQLWKILGFLIAIIEIPKSFLGWFVKLFYWNWYYPVPESRFELRLWRFYEDKAPKLPGWIKARRKASQKGYAVDYEE